MRLGTKILLGWATLTIVGALNGWYIPAVISVVLYIVYAVVRDRLGYSPSGHPIRGRHTRMPRGEIMAHRSRR